MSLPVLAEKNPITTTIQTSRNRDKVSVRHPRLAINRHAARPIKSVQGNSYRGMTMAKNQKGSG